MGKINLIRIQKMFNTLSIPITFQEFVTVVVIGSYLPDMLVSMCNWHCFRQNIRMRWTTHSQEWFNPRDIDLSA